jgi:hypothetical protein
MGFTCHIDTYMHNTGVYLSLTRKIIIMEYKKALTFLISNTIVRGLLFIA